MKKKKKEIINISADPFDDYAIKEFINNYPEADFCDWCEEEKPSVSIVTLAKLIDECLLEVYDDPYNLGGGYNPDEVDYEDRFPGLKVIDTKDLLNDYLNGTPYEIIEKIAELLSNEYWTDKKLYGPSGQELLRASWTKFTDIIKHKIRFMFFNKKVPTYKPSYDEYSNPYTILEEIGLSIIGLNLITKFKKSELNIFRARQHSHNEKINTIETLGSPPNNKARTNRMSPAGISMFYGAFDENTAITEIIDIGKSSDIITTGQFQNLKELTLIDFSKLTYISIFDKGKANLRDQYFFLKDFIHDLSSPISNDDSQHIEYVPTQVVTEYFKNVFETEFDIEIHGLIYPSARVKDGKCIVLFFNQNQLTDDKTKKYKYLFLQIKTLKEMEVSKIKFNIIIEEFSQPNKHIEINDLNWNIH